ncbi:MAG: hypothetical protein ACKVOH_01210 [Chlamydiales bacterium]
MVKGVSAALLQQAQAHREAVENGTVVVLGGLVLTAIVVGILMAVGGRIAEAKNGTDLSHLVKIGAYMATVPAISMIVVAPIAWKVTGCIGYHRFIAAHRDHERNKII